jgi:hypothetical protein
MKLSRLGSGGELADRYPIRAGFARCCARPQRPCGSRAAEKRDELAPLHTEHEDFFPCRLLKYHLGATLKVVICPIIGFQSACSVRI